MLGDFVEVERTSEQRAKVWCSSILCVLDGSSQAQADAADIQPHARKSTYMRVQVHIPAQR